MARSNLGAGCQRPVSELDGVPSVAAHEGVPSPVFCHRQARDLAYTYGQGGDRAGTFVPPSIYAYDLANGTRRPNDSEIGRCQVLHRGRELFLLAPLMVRRVFSHNAPRGFVER